MRDLPDRARELRRSLDNPAALCSALGLLDAKAKRQPQGLIVRCPAHDDDEPSCSIRVAKDGTIGCKCQACGWSGDALTLIAQVEGLDLRGDFQRVLERAAELAGVRLEDVRTPAAARSPRPAVVEEPSMPALDDERFAELVSVLTGPLDDPGAEAVAGYVAGRGLAGGTDLVAMREARAVLEAAQDRFGPKVLALSGLFSIDSSGELRTAGGVPALRHAGHVLAILWRRPDGTVYVVQRRRVDGEKKSKYVFPEGRSPRWPFGVERTAGADPHLPIVFTEGALDAIARGELDRRAGLERLVLGVPSVTIWKPAWAELARGRVAFVATDADTEGDRVVAGWAADLYRAGAAEVRRLRPGDGAKDWGDVLARGAGETDEPIPGPATPPAPASSGLVDLAARINAEGVGVAFKPDVIAAAAALEQTSSEFQEMVSAIKKTDVNLLDWKRAVSVARKAEARRRAAERAAERDRAAKSLNGDDAARYAIRKRLLYRSGAEGDLKIGKNLANLITIFTLDPDFRGRLAYHALREAIVITKPIAWHPEEAPAVRTEEWTTEDSIRGSAWLSRRWNLDLNSKMVEEAIIAVARKRVVDPLLDYFRALRWDRKPRLDGWLSTYLGAPDDNYTRAVGPRWLISGVARALRPGCKVDCVLTLEGPQGIRKSSALRALCPDDSMFYDDELDIGDKDAPQALRGKFIAEMAELSSASKARLEALKAFITRQTDTYRPSYGRQARDFPRRLIFAGSTNRDVYLVDDENRRFWPVKCATIDVDALRRDRDQLWAEALVRFKAGEKWYVDTPELAALCGNETEERRQRDPWEEPVARWLATKLDDPRGVTTTDVLEDAVKVKVQDRTRADEMRAAEAIRAAGWKKGPRRRGDGGRARSYLPPGF